MFFISLSKLLHTSPSMWAETRIRIAAQKQFNFVWFNSVINSIIYAPPYESLHIQSISY